MTTPPALTDEQTRLIETLLDLEPTIVLGLRSTPRETERETKRCLNTLRQWIADEGDARVSYDDREDWYRVDLAGTTIGYVKTSLYSVEGQNDGKTQLGYIAHRIDRRMLKDPTRPTLREAVARIVQAWNASDQDVASLRLVTDSHDAPSRRDAPTDPETASAVLAWIRVVTRIQGQTPTLGSAARAFGLTPGEVHDLLSRPALAGLDRNRRSDPAQPLRLPSHGDA